MSVVACRVSEDKITVASDSITVRGYTQSRSINSFSKLSFTNGMIIGTVGSAEEGSLFMLFCTNHKPERSDESAILAFMTEFAAWKKAKADSNVINNDYILVLENKAFSIHRFFVEEILHYTAIGAGDDYALAALYLGHDVQKAVEVACELSILCERPIVYYEMVRNQQA